MAICLMETKTIVAMSIDTILMVTKFYPNSNNSNNSKTTQIKDRTIKEKTLMSSLGTLLRR